MGLSIAEVLADPEYQNANEATKQAIFDKRVGNDDDFKSANAATQNAIRQKWGLSPVEEKTAGDKFIEPLKSMSVEDWQKNSLIAPAINYMVGASPFGTEEQYQTAKENLTGKIGNVATGISQFLDNPTDAVKGMYNAVTENPAGVMGNIVKGAIYDPELLFAPGVRSVTAPVAKAAVAPVVAPYKIGQGMLNVGRGELGSEASALRAITPEKTGTLYRAESAVNPNSGINPHMSASQATLANATGAIPKEGQMLNAIGESIARGYQGKGAGMNALIDLAGLGVGGVPLSSTLRAGGAVLNTLFNKNAFKKLAEYERAVKMVQEGAAKKSARKAEESITKGLSDGLFD